MAPREHQNDQHGGLQMTERVWKEVKPKVIGLSDRLLLNTFLAQAGSIAVGRRSDGRQAMTLVVRINVIIFLIY